MNLKEEILKEHSKKQTLKIANYIGNDKKRFAELMHLFFANQYRVTQRAAWIVSNCFQKYPELLNTYLKPMIKNLEKENLHDAVKRNTLRILQFVSISKDLQGIAFQNCMNLFLLPDEAIAVKVFAMTVMANICKQEPELKNELILVIEEQMPYGSAAYKSRGTKILKLLNKL